MNYILLILLLNLGIANPAYAYVGPGISAILLQLIVGGFAGLIMVFKLYWRRLFKQKKNPKKKNLDKSVPTKNNDRNS